MNTLSDREAYLAMFSFLECRYNLTKSDDIGSLLGDMFFRKDGSTTDPAIWDDWCESIRKAKSGSVQVSLDAENS